MKNRSPVFFLTAALGGCLVLLACAAAIGFGAYYLSLQGNLFAAFSPAVMNRIVYVGNDLNIYTVDPKGTQKTPLTKDADGGNARSYEYPTWSPDNRHIAFVGINFSGGNANDGTLYSSTLDGGKLVPLYKSDQFIPFYLYWSPNGQFVTFLTSKAQGQLALRSAQGDKENSTEELESGAPLYWAWSPDSQRMFLHVNGARSDSDQARLALLPFAQRNSAHPLPSNPGSFAAPQWSPDGQHLLFSTEDENQRQTVAVSNAQGEESKVLFNYDGRISFTWSPSGDRIAYIVTDASMRLPNYGVVRVVDANGQNAHDISDEHALAFFWSPNGKRLAYLTVQLASNGSSFRAVGPAQQGGPQLQMQWKVKDFDTDAIHIAASFVPTEDFINILPFYDQYARSMTFWSPDSRSLVYTSSESSSSGTIWVADAMAEAQPTKIAEGLVAFWSWR
jgi:TolB protein